MQKAFFLCLALAGYFWNCGLYAAPCPEPGPWKPDPAQREKLRRSLTLLDTSTPDHRNTVRVLFYGQSITEQAWWKEVEHYLRTTYTNANLIVENRAIGGHAAQLLVKTAEADLYPYQPDLLIFHVYGSHIEYENIIRRVRERTCADILLQTDHITHEADLHEETDPAKLSPKQWDPWMNHVFLPATAAKYGACRADIHELWKNYLNANQFKASDFLVDGVHLNTNGNWLLAEFLKPYLAPLPVLPGYDPYNDDRVHTLNFSAAPGQQQVQMEFMGSRVDLVFRPNVMGRVQILIDGQSPSTKPELYGFNRVSAFPGSNWPILLKVGSQTPLAAEDWNLKITDISQDGKLCHFNLHGSVTGDDGEGVSTNRFVSKSGRVIIEPDDWNLNYCMAVFRRSLPEGYNANWRAGLRGLDVAESPAPIPGVEAVVTLAQTLTPGAHTIQLKGERLGELIQSLRCYSPKTNSKAP